MIASLAASGLATGFKSLSGLDSETEVVDHVLHPPAGVVTDNKDDSGRYLLESEGIGWNFNSHTRPFSDGLIAYNGHAGLGANAVVCLIEPTRIEFPNITNEHLRRQPAAAGSTLRR
jgi:hypothetical protein